MDEAFPCVVIVVDGVDPAALLAAGLAPAPPVVKYARAPAAPGSQSTGTRPAATQGASR